MRHEEIDVHTHLINTPVKDCGNDFCLVVSSARSAQDSTTSLVNIIDNFRVQWDGVTRIESLIPTLRRQTDGT